MAKKRRKKGKRRATPAQLRALKKAHAALRAKRRGKKRKSPKKRKSSKRRKVSRRKSVAHHMRAASRRGFQPHSGGSGVAAHYHSGARSYAANVAAASKRRRKKARGMKKFGKKGGIVTAASIIKGAKSRGYKAWVCAGPKRSGCGGGKKGGHVVGILK